jgi:hypothetical protein
MPQPVQLSIRIYPGRAQSPQRPPEEALRGRGHSGANSDGPVRQDRAARSANHSAAGRQPSRLARQGPPLYGAVKSLRDFGGSGVLESGNGLAWTEARPLETEQATQIDLKHDENKMDPDSDDVGLGGHARGGDVGLRFRRVHGRCEAVSAGRVPGVGGKARKPRSALRVRTRRTTDQALLQGLLEGFPGRAGPISSEVGFGCRRGWRKRGSSSLNGPALTLHVAPGNPACQGGSTTCKAGP